jgi:hypothetical protein
MVEKEDEDEQTLLGGGGGVGLLAWARLHEGSLVFDSGVRHTWFAQSIPSTTFMVGRSTATSGRERGTSVCKENQKKKMKIVNEQLTRLSKSYQITKASEICSNQTPTTLFSSKRRPFRD